MTVADLADLTLRLCAIPSETGQEHDLADFIEAQARVATGDAAVWRGGNAVVCAPCPANGRPTVALVGHLDTVRCAAEQPLTVRDGRVYGCGASDMKAGLAVMVALLTLWPWLNDGPLCPVWIFYDREEGPYAENGLEPVLDSGAVPPLDLAVILEPTDATLQLGCLGVLNVHARVPGRRAHSARPWEGDNAVYRALPLLRRLAGVPVREVRVHGLPYYEVLTVTQVWTETPANVVPDALYLNLNVRFAPNRTPEDAWAEVRLLLGADAEATLRDAAPAAPPFADHPLVRDWQQRARLDVRPKQAWTDVARFAARGIPAVNFGPGETAQAHQANESCSLALLDRAYHALRLLFRPDAA